MSKGSKLTKRVRVPLPDVAVGKAVVVPVGDAPVLVVRTETGLRACRALCPHQNRSLANATIRGRSIVCPWHGALFSLDDGRSDSRLTTRALTLYDCREDEGAIVLDLPD